MVGIRLGRLILSGIVGCICTWLLLAPAVGFAQTVPTFQTQKEQLIRDGWQSLEVAPQAAPPPGSQVIKQHAPNEPDDLRDWTKLAFRSYRDGNWEIYQARGDGSVLNRVTNNPASDWYPALNRGTTRILFVSDRSGNADIYAANPDGSTLSRLTNHTQSDSYPSWSPNRQHVVYASNRSGHWDIWLTDPSGSNHTQLTANIADDMSPAWSPDGSTIAWVRRGSSTDGLWLMNADGSNQRQLLSGLRFLQNPAWSPDGTRLAFDCDIDWDYWNELLTVNADGSQLQTVIDANSDETDLWLGSWSPDNKWLVFSRVEYVVINNQLYIASAYVEKVNATPHGTPQRLTSSGLDLDPHWETSDITPPSSQIQQLPDYSRAAGFDVNWSGSDSGGAGLAMYEVEYRVGPNGAWTLWYHGSATGKSFTLTTTVGQTLAFRVRAVDSAGNREAWPPQGGGQSSTTSYTYTLDGLVTDGRGVPLANVQMSISPAAVTPGTTNALGSYQSRLAAQGSHALEWSRPGYESATATLPIYTDLTRGSYLPGGSNAVENGSFEINEGSLHGWTSGGSLAEDIGTGAGYSSSTSAVFEMTCTFPCLTNPELVVEHGSSPDLATDSSNNLSMVWDGYLKGRRGAFYTVRTPDGVWETPEMVAEVRDYYEGITPKIAVDGADTLHVVWNGQRGVYYSQRAPGESWTLPAVISSGSVSGIAADSFGGVHVVLRSYDSGDSRVEYLEKLPNGQWKEPYKLSADNGYQLPDVAIGPDNTVHFLWQEVNRGIFYRQRPLYGAISPPEQIFSGTGYAFEHQRLAIDSAGGVHAFWTWAYDGYYALRSPNGSWSTPLSLPKSKGDADLIVDGQGVIHMIGSSGLSTQEGTYYRERSASGQWTAPYQLQVGAHSSLPAAVAIDTNGIFHGVWGGYLSDAFHYQHTASATETGVASLSQPISIPSDDWRPTLSFFYEIDRMSLSNPTAPAAFQVAVQEGIESTVVFSDTVSQPWTLGWADLSPWAGQAVSVTFTMHQTAGLPHPRLALDNVFLGSWKTPIVQQVSPVELPAGVSADILITGDNFIGVPTVILGGAILNDVVLLQPGVLRATVPATISPGMVYLKVRNPEGQVSAYPTRIRIGRFVFLPWLTAYE